MKKTATTASQDSYVQGGNADSVTALGAPTTVEVEHKKGCDVARLKRTITVIGASIEDPPGTATGGTVPVNVTVATTPITPAGTVETGQFVTGIQTGADANGHTTINPQNGEAVTGIGAGQPVEVVTGITEAKFNCSELDDCEGNPANVCYQIDVDGIKVPIVGACTGGCPTNSTTVCLPDIDISPGDTVTVTAQPELFVKTPAGDRFPITHGQIILCAEIEYAPPGGFEEDC